MERNEVIVSEQELARQKEFTRKMREMNDRRTRTPLALVDTFGCQQNVADGEVLMGMLREMGYELTRDEQQADVILLNTCAIREHAEKRVYGHLGRLSHTKAAKPDQIICLCGCMAQQKVVADKVKNSYHHVDLVLGPQAEWRLPELLRELDAEFPLHRVDAVGVSEKPRPVEGSYMPCFLTGLAVAQGLALARGVPLVRTTHQQGHIAAALLSAAGASLFARRVLVFHISGGTTELLLCSGTSVVCRVGGSTDLYAGQAVDRIGVKLGFAFPAGAELSSLASECSEEIKPKVSVKGADCSFSGLENQCAALLECGAAPAYVAKYCLSAVGQTVLRMICAAQEQYPGVPVVCAGGVMSSDIIRAYVQRTQPDIYFVPGRYSSDNAIGVAVLAAKEVQAWPM